MKVIFFFSSSLYHSLSIYIYLSFTPFDLLHIFHQLQRIFFFSIKLSDKEIGTCVNISNICTQQDTLS